MRSSTSPDQTRTEWAEAANYITFTGGDPPSVFAETLSKTVPVEPHRERILDIGCGSGIIGIFLLVEKRAAFVTFSDILEEMVAVTCRNIAEQISRQTISESQVGYLVSSFADISPAFVGKHTLIVFNPPQLPQQFLSDEKQIEIESDPTMAHFRLGGPDGLDIIRKFLEWYAALDKPRPNAVVLVSSFLGISRIEEAISDQGLRYEFIAQTRVPLRAFLCDAADAFSVEDTKDRMLQKDTAGKWTKTLLTIQLGP